MCPIGERELVLRSAEQSEPPAKQLQANEMYDQVTEQTDTNWHSRGVRGHLATNSDNLGYSDVHKEGIFYAAFPTLSRLAFRVKSAAGRALTAVEQTRKQGRLNAIESGYTLSVPLHLAVDDKKPDTLQYCTILYYAHCTDKSRLMPCEFRSQNMPNVRQSLFRRTSGRPCHSQR